MEKMAIPQVLTGALFAFLVSPSFGETCAEEGIHDRGSLRGPGYVVLGEPNQFSTSVSLLDLLDDPNVEFFTSEDFFVGSRDYSSIGSDAESKIDIVFDEASSLGTSWVKANEISDASPYISEFCMNVNVQEHRPSVEEIDTIDFYATGSTIHVKFEVRGSLDETYSQRGSNGQGPLYTVQKSCRDSRSWTTVAQNSASEIYEISSNCNLAVRVKAFDGNFFSEYNGERYWYSDLDPGDETGPNSPACLARCPLSLEPYRSHCMRSNPVCH
ncbi:hypothetical protein [Marinimicrobium agarilyticum]|uniref:hypothetical protein n=1 Tax=Marinimicrobium agarilyticum TaxID=306546 RepID=UPI0012F6CF2C|nr:hypothetical protein [Marinimicrobium agarilyticum]